MSADRRPERGVDLVALVAGSLFLLLSLASLTVGVLDLPRLGAAPFWVLLIAVGLFLLVGELRAGRSEDDDGASEAPGSADLTAWEQDTYR